MKVFYCDICGRAISDPPGGEVSFGTKLNSIRYILAPMTGGEPKTMDLCPKCNRRMIDYLKKTAKKDEKA